ncbi:cellulase [Opitutaceae bacterium EW11]|nr:cellulase [Opitutaceae bacterium EW11]
MVLLRRPARIAHLTLALWLGLSSVPGFASSGPSAEPTSPPISAQAYEWRNVAIGGGGFVTGVLFHPTEAGLAYARTDVGGAYRREGTDAAWVPLQDSLSRPDWNLLGVDGIAVDPNDASRVYLAAGTYVSPEVGNGALLASDDRGRTWTRIPLPFPLGGNEPGRNSGERLAVDPHDGRLLYLGTRTNGLWRSKDHGATWSKVASFPGLSDDSVQQRTESDRFNPLSRPVGIPVVVFDPRGKAGEPTPRIYAAISRADRGIVASRDAGQTWSQLAGQPVGLRPTDMIVLPDGTLVATYADLPGPNRMSAGTVWKYAPETESWTEIAPEKGSFGYACATFDPSSPATLLVSTWNRLGGEEIFRSLDAGKTWHPMLSKSRWDHSAAPYTAGMHIHWISSVAVDPRDRDRVLFTTGYGVWQSLNATASDRNEPVQWQLAVRGIEETVPLTLVSPLQGPHLISGLGDIDGFLHHDLDATPAQGAFQGPRFKNTESIDFAGPVPTFFVRSGTTYKMDVVHGAWSDDGGEHWTRFVGEPPLPAAGLTFPGFPGGRFPGNAPAHRTGPITVSADGKIIVWTLMGQSPCFSTDRGATWAPSQGAPANLAVAADRVVSSHFYGVDLFGGALYVSTDGAQSFKKVREDLGGQRARFARPNLRPVPGRTGEVWLTLNNRLHHFTELGKNEINVAGVDSAASVGFGLAPGGKDYPAVFLAGQIGGVHGLYRSDDAGRTWIRISDPSHQFGGAGLVTGDPRVFGRVYFATGGRGIFYGDPKP